MHQTKLESLLEAFINILFGYCIQFTAFWLFAPLAGIEVNLSASAHLGIYMTFVSIARSYAIRRWFNAGLHRIVGKIVKRFLWRWVDR